MDVISSKVYCIIAIMGGLIDGVVVACDEQSAKDEVRAALDYVDSYGNLDEDYVACYSFDLPCADPAPVGHWEVALVLLERLAGGGYGEVGRQGHSNAPGVGN